MPAAFRVDPDAVCEACGRHGAFRFDGETLCGDCYAERGSCCSTEFSGGGRTPTSAEEDKEPSASTRPVEAKDDRSN